MLFPQGSPTRGSLLRSTFSAKMYENGQGGVPQDYAQAYTWYKLAASNAADDRTRDMDVKARDPQSLPGWQRREYLRSRRRMHPQ